MKLYPYKINMVIAFLFALLLIATSCGENTEQEEKEPQEYQEEQTENESESVLEAEKTSENVEIKSTCYKLNYWYGEEFDLYNEATNPGYPNIITEPDDIYHLDAFTKSYALEYQEPFKIVYNQPKDGIPFLEIWGERYDDAFFQEKDVLIFWMRNQFAELQYEVTGFAKDSESGNWKLHMRCVQNLKNMLSAYDRWAFIVEVPKGIFSGENPEPFPEIVMDYAYEAYQDCYYFGENGVSLESLHYKVQAIYNSERWGVKVQTEQSLVGENLVNRSCFAEVAYWQNGFFLDPTSQVVETTTPDRKTVQVGYDQQGNWLWVDYMHPSGKYAAINYGATGSNAENLLEVVLTAELGN